MAFAAFTVLMMKNLTYIGFRAIMYFTIVGSVLAEHTPCNSVETKVTLAYACYT